MPMPTITPADTLTLIMGASPDAYSWYLNTDLQVTGADPGDATAWDKATAWTAALTVCDPDAPADSEEGRRYEVGHAEVMRAVRKIIGAPRPEYVGDACVRACKDLIFKGPDEADFDAATADEVLQVAMFGKVVYG